MPVRSSREEMLRQWVAENPIGMYVAEASAERTPQVVSRGLARLLGYASSEAVPLADLWDRHLHPEDREATQAAWAGGSEDGLSRRVVTYRLNDRDGQVHWMREESAPLEGHPDRVQAVLLDVTESVEAERRLQRSAHDLHERVKELDCLYAISHLSGEESVPQLLARVAQILPRAWQFPDRAWCRIHFDGKTYASEGEAPGPAGQQADIVIRGDTVGRIEMGYRADPDAPEEPAFLKEEWTLLDGIARSLAEALERRQAVESLRKSEKLYRTLAMNIPGTLVGLFDRDLQCTLAEGALKGVLTETRVEGRDLAEVWRGDTALLVELCRAAIDGEDRSVDYWWRGMALSVRVVPVPEVRGDRGGMFVIRDMTDRRELEKEILEVSSREQRRIGQDLHDSLGQLLTGLMCLGGTLNRHLAQDCPQHAARAEEITEIAQQAMLEVRALARGLNPIDLDARGLASSLQELAYDCENIFHVACLCDTTEAPPVEDPTAATQLYRIAQEAVSNAVRHGQATTIVLKLYRDDGHGVLSVEDNGRGFSPRGQQRKGMGLRIMQYRTETIGGVFTLRSSRGRGTRIECRFPLGKGESAVRGEVSHAERSKRRPTNRHRR